MLFFMGAASHLPINVGMESNVSLYWIVFAVILLALEFNACSGHVFAFSACVPGSLITSNLTLLDGGVVDWGAPGYDIHWSQPDGPDSFRIDVVNELAPDDHLVYFGIGVSPTCFEGTFYQLPGPDPIGAFSLCPP